MKQSSKLLPSINQVAQTLFAWVALWAKQEKAPAPDMIATWSPREWRIARSILIVHGMGPVIGYWLTQQGDHPNLPPDMNQYLRSQFEENTKRINMISASKAKISRLLSRNNIEFFCFKGLTLSESLYAHIGMRPMADIDVYTGQQHKNKLRNILEGKGFAPHVINHEGMTVYPQSDTTNTVDWHGASVSTQDESLWYQGESTKLPYSIDIHFTMEQGIQEFRYDFDTVFQQALRSGKGLTSEQTYVYLLLHASKHLRCRCARWIQLYDLYLWQQKIVIDEDQVLATAIEHNCCHLLLWPLQLTRQVFSAQKTKLEQQLIKYTSWRYRYLIGRENLAQLSHCNPQPMGLMYGLLWTQNLGKIRQWLKLSSKASEAEFKREYAELQQAPPIITRMIKRITKHFNQDPRAQWQIFALQGLRPHKDWN